VSESFWSKYHDWFVEMGYPQLDIQKYEDGEWAIIETLNRPVVPSMTRFKVILQGMKNVEISRGFIEKYVKQIDPLRKEFWDRERRATQQAEDAVEIRERHAEDSAERAAAAIVGNDALMERITRNGLSEMNLDKIAKHVPKGECR
jgi:hypothetical protein